MFQIHYIGLKNILVKAFCLLQLFFLILFYLHCLLTFLSFSPLSFSLPLYFSFFLLRFSFFLPQIFYYLLQFFFIFHLQFFLLIQHFWNFHLHSYHQLLNFLNSLKSNFHLLCFTLCQYFFPSIINLYNLISNQFKLFPLALIKFINLITPFLLK